MQFENIKKGTIMKNTLLFFYLLIITSYSFSIPEEVPIDIQTAHWSCLLIKKYSALERIWNMRNAIVLHKQENVFPFTQLLFSWNALRPKYGYFSFYVQVRDALTKHWGKWHHMLDWGKEKQCSYKSNSDGFSSYHYVRLEIDDQKYADGFKIKIVPHYFASCGVFHSCSISLSNYNAFKSESLHTFRLPSVYLKNFPAIAQLALNHKDKNRICSPVSCSMMVSYLTKCSCNPLEYAEYCFDCGLNTYGSWPFNTVYAFEKCPTHSFSVWRMNSFRDIHAQLTKKLPVIVSVRGILPGALKPFPHGHLLVVIGWDNDSQEVICHDPAAESDDTVLKRYPIYDFLQAWQLSYRLSYCISQ